MKSIWHRVAHGKCVGVDSGVDIKEVIVNSGIGSHTPWFFFGFGQRYTEITHYQGIFWLSTESLSRSTLHLKEGGVCTLVLCSLAIVMSCIDASVRIVTKSRRWDLYLYSPSFWIRPLLLECRQPMKSELWPDSCVSSTGCEGGSSQRRDSHCPTESPPTVRQDKIVNRKKRSFFLNFQTYGKVLKSKSHSDICTMYNSAKKQWKNHLSKPPV